MSEKKKLPTYTADFKESAVQLAVSSNQPIAQTARELGVNRNTLYTWIGKYHHSGKGSQSQADDEQLYDKLKRLQRENRRLKEERDILKKAAAYFARAAE